MVFGVIVNGIVGIGIGFVRSLLDCSPPSLRPETHDLYYKMVVLVVVVSICSDAPFSLFGAVAHKKRRDGKKACSCVCHLFMCHARGVIVSFITKTTTALKMSGG